MKLKTLSFVVMSLFAAATFAQSSGTGTGSSTPSAPTNTGTDPNQGPGSGSAPSNAPSAGSGSNSTMSSSFEALDKNGDGYISKAEAKKDRVVNKQWKQFDTDKDGKLSRAEYDASAAGAGNMGTSGSGSSK
jgi:hypothetical protein